MRRLVVAAACLCLAACAARPADYGRFEDTEGLQYAPELHLQLPEMTRLPSGVYYQDVAVGSGVVLQRGDSVVVEFSGWLPDGTLFDSSRGRGPLQYRHGAGRVLRGWDEGLASMRVGGIRRLVIPPQLAYGRQRQGPIPPMSTLIFEVALVQIHRN